MAQISGDRQIYGDRRTNPIFSNGVNLGDGNSNGDNNTKEGTNTDCPPGLYYPLIYTTQTINRNQESCTVSQNNNNIIGAECFLRSKDFKCGSINGDSAYTIIGNFCEKHALEFLNVCFLNLVVNGEYVELSPVNFKKVNPIKLFPIICAQPLDVQPIHFMETFNNSPVPESYQEIRSALAQILSAGTIACGKDNFRSLETEICKKFFSFGETRNSAAKEYFNCWKNSYVYMYFTENYLDTHSQTNKWLYKLKKEEKYGKPVEIPASEGQPKMYLYSVHILNAFCIFDVMTLTSFQMSRQIKSDGQVEEHVPNCYILDGNLIMGVGFGLKNGTLNTKTHYLYQHVYNNDINEIVSQRQFHSNVHKLYLYGESDSNKLAIFAHKNIRSLADEEVDESIFSKIKNGHISGINM